MPMYSYDQVLTDVTQVYEQLTGRPAPKADLKNKPRSDSYEPATIDKLQGTITLDIDPTTGLIAVDSCPVIKTKTFVIGQEPKRYCGPEYHKKKP